MLFVLLSSTTFGSKKNVNTKFLFCPGLRVCFSKQKQPILLRYMPKGDGETLKAGEKREFNLTFFLDPKVVDDNKTKNISDVTLSFTFFSSDYYMKDKV